MQCCLCDGVALTVVLDKGKNKGFCKSHKEDGQKLHNRSRLKQLSSKGIHNSMQVNTEEHQWKTKNKGKKYDVARHTL